MIRNKILILFAHPLFEKSQINKELIKAIPTSAQITFHDLYEAYPEFDIDIQKEQNLLLAHDLIIWHHPMYWFSCPPILKQWIDLVLQHGWAYGKEGKNLLGKTVFQVITTGGGQQHYCATGKNNYTVLELLAPFKQTAKICNMNYLPPFVIHGTHKITSDELKKHTQEYHQLLTYLTENPIEFPIHESFPYLNDWIKTKHHGQ